MRGRGVEKSYLQIALMFQEYGHEVHLILRENIMVLDCSQVKNVHILQGESFSQKVLDLKNLLDLLKKQSPISLIISSNVSFLQATDYALDHVYFSVNMSWGYRLLKRLRFKKYLQVRREYQGKQIIAVSQGVKKDLLQFLRIKPKHIEVIYDPYDVQMIQKQANESFCMVGIKPFIVHVGAFDKIKRHDVLLKAFSLLKIDIDLYLIGTGKEETKIQKLAKKLGIGNRVYFLGWQDNPYPYIKQAQLTVLSSESEALPRVLIESLIVGTTVVSTDCNFGPREILTDSLQKYLSPVNDSKKLSEKIEWALEHPMDIKSKNYDKFAKVNIFRQYLDLMH